MNTPIAPDDPNREVVTTQGYLDSLLTRLREMEVLWEGAEVVVASQARELVEITNEQAQAEQRVVAWDEATAAMTELLIHTRIIPENGRRVTMAGHGKRYDAALERLLAALIPPQP